MSPDDFIDFSDEKIPTVADLAEYERRRNGDGPALDSWSPIDLSALPDHPPVEPTLGGLGFVYPGKRHVFSGPQESAKTLAAYVIGLEVIRSGSVIMLIDFEMGQWDARRRLVELGATKDELGRIFYFEPSERADQAVIDSLLEREPELVIIDAAAGAFGLQHLDDNKRGDVEHFATVFIQPFWRQNIATIVLDHVVKSVDNRGAYAIGSERKVGGADVHLGFEVVTPIKRGGHGLYKVITHKDRGGHLKRGKLAEFVLLSDPVTHMIAWEFNAPVETDEEEPFRPTHLMERVSRFLQDVGESSQRTVKAGVKGRDEYIVQALDRLVSEGYAVVSEGPRAARMFTSVKGYIEAHDDRVPLSPDRGPDSVPPLRPTGSPPIGEPDAVDAVRKRSTESRGNEADDIPF